MTFRPTTTRAPTVNLLVHHPERAASRVERLFHHLKQFRRLATRYEKLKATFLGLLHLALGFIRFRNQQSVNTR